MNTNMTLTCKVCESDVDCRFGYSNRAIQPLSFACPHCAALICVTMDCSNPPQTGFEFSGCSPSQDNRSSFKDDKNPFVDLHLDFPVRFGKYVMGDTPFMIAMQELRKNSQSAEEAHAKLAFHNERLERLNYFSDRHGEIRTIVRLYQGRNKQLFKQRVSDFLQKDLGSSLKPEDVNAALYQFLTRTFLPFVHFDDVRSAVEGFDKITRSLAGGPFDQFVRKLVDSGYLVTLQRDCLSLYPQVYETELAMRPALYLDLIGSYEVAKTAARISAKDFYSYKDLYKDILEVMGRLLVLVAGINNIIHRGGDDEFPLIGGGRLGSLDKFSAKPMAEKFKYLDNSWYEVDRAFVNTEVRNAIAHNNVQYDEITQIIEYFPEGGRVMPSSPQQIYFLDFMRMILIAFREMNNLHHLVKCLFYYEYLILQKA